MDKLLSAMKSSPSSIVIEKTLIQHICRESNHRFASSFSSIVSNKSQSLDETAYDELCNFALRYFFMHKVDCIYNSHHGKGLQKIYLFRLPLALILPNNFYSLCWHMAS